MENGKRIINKSRAFLNTAIEALTNCQHKPRTNTQANKWKKKIFIYQLQDATDWESMARKYPATCIEK